MAEDLVKIFEQYWLAVELDRLPPNWPPSFHTQYNQANPALLNLNGDTQKMYLSAAPPAFCANRTDDLTAILTAINQARESISVAVMDYSPTFYHMSPNTYWPYIDNALRSAAYFNGVRVRLLFSFWNHTRLYGIQFMKSLDALDDIEVKLFQMPELTPQVPHSRVAHSKFLVSEKTSFISTSNWSADYFVTTSGVACITENTQLINQLQTNFDRDWNSQYAYPVTDY